MSTNSYRSPWKGILFMTLTWVLFAIMSALAKHSYTYTTPAVTFFAQNFIALLVLLPYFFKNGVNWKQSSQWNLIIARGVLGAAAFCLLFTSLSKIHLTDATLLNNAAPLYVPFFAALFLKTRLRASLLFSAAIGFIGILFILKPSAGLLQLGALPALISGIFSALVMILMRMLAQESPKRVLFSFLLIATTGSAPFAIAKLLSVPAACWPFLICVGVLFACGQMCYTRSFLYAEPTTLAPFSYSFVAASGMIDWLVWNRPPTLSSATGMTLIALGGVLTILQQKRQSEKLRQEPN